MKNMIRLSINVSKITKDRLYKGAKGTYLSCTILEKDEPDQYDNTHMVIEDVTKEERSQGVKGVIIGNGKFVMRTSKPPQSDTLPPASSTAPADDDSDDVPF